MEAALYSPLGKMTLGLDVVTIGNTPDNQLMINDVRASSHHALIRAEAQGYSITDWDSANGTYVNEQRLTPKVPRLLNAGDTIHIGDTRFTYQVGGPPPPQSQMASNPAGAPFVVPGPLPSTGPQLNTPGVNYANVPPGNAPAGFQQQQSPQWQQQPFMPSPGQIQGQASFPNQNLPRRQPTQKRGPLLIVLALVGSLLVLALLGFFLFTTLKPTNSSPGGTTPGAPTASTNVSSPTGTLQTYCSALKKGDAQGAYDQLSTSAKSKTSVARIAQALQIINSPQVGGIKDCTVSNVQENGSTATATVTITLNKGKPVNAPAKLVKENGVWKIDTNNTLTSP